MTSLGDSSQGSATAATNRMADDRLRDLSASTAPATGRSRDEHLTWVLEQVRQALIGMRFGQVVITVQDSLPIQIERTEKTRLR